MLLAAVLLLTLCACGKSAAPDVTPTPEPTAETLNYDVPCAVTATDVYPFEGGWNIKDLARIGNTLLLAASQSGNYRAALADYTVSDDDTVSLSPVRELAAMFGPWMTKSNLLGWICSTCINDYVDYANGTCDFNNDSFKALLEWCSEMNPDYEGEVMPEGYATYSEDEALLHLNDYMNIGTLANSMYPINVGFPSGAGNGSYYSCVYAMGMAIPAAAENKDGAWNFIRSQLVLQAQTWSEDAIASLPVNMEAMQRVIDAIAVNDPTQAARLTELLNGITTVISGSDVAIRETIIDCAKAYFNGDRSLDDTAAAIQDKLSLYMAERYGW